MKLAIDQIKVEKDSRIRKEIGSLDSLEQSISKVGLINPILINGDYTLLAGYRRLQACKNLGLTEVPVRVIDSGEDQLKMLDLEVAENFFRKDFTPEEILATEIKRQEIIELTRKKGLFERFWLWLKGLFAEQPAPPKEHVVSLHQTEEKKSSDIPEQEPEQEPEKESKQEPEQEPEQKSEQESQVPEQESSVPEEEFERPASKNNERTIQWRTS